MILTPGSSHRVKGVGTSLQGVPTQAVWMDVQKCAVLLDSLPDSLLACCAGTATLAGHGSRHLEHMRVVNLAASACIDFAVNTASAASVMLAMHRQCGMGPCASSL